MTDDVPESAPNLYVDVEGEDNQSKDEEEPIFEVPSNMEVIYHILANAGLDPVSNIMLMQGKPNLQKHMAILISDMFFPAHSISDNLLDMLTTDHLKQVLIVGDQARFQNEIMKWKNDKKVSTLMISYFFKTETIPIS